MFPLKVDIFYSNSDITSLRWISEIKNELHSYKKWITIRAHDLNSAYAKKRRIKTESVILNDRKIEPRHISNILNNLIQ